MAPDMDVWLYVILLVLLCITTMCLAIAIAMLCRLRSPVLDEPVRPPQLAETVLWGAGQGCVVPVDGTVVRKAEYMEPVKENRAYLLGGGVVAFA